LAGGSSGLAIDTEDPPSGLLLIRQASGNHPGQLSGDELAILQAWIEAGAPER
jgi:hypothetical protein